VALKTTNRCVRFHNRFDIFPPRPGRDRFA
jgi:hypothetical protein